MAGSSAILTPDRTARMIRPDRNVTASTPSTSRVVAALPALFLRNAGTPLWIAWTPVSAADPEANALATMNATANPPTAAPSGETTSNPADSARNSPPRNHSRASPQTISSVMQAMKAYTGIANDAPVRRSPRRLTAATTMTPTTAIRTWWERRDGTIEPTAAAAAERETATVST